MFGEFKPDNVQPGEGLIAKAFSGLESLPQTSSLARSSHPLITANTSPLILNFTWIACLVVFYLKPQKLVNGFDGLAVARRNTNAATAFKLFELILDLSLQPLHRRRARRGLRVDEHRRGEIARRKFPRDVF